MCLELKRFSFYWRKHRLQKFHFIDISYCQSLLESWNIKYKRKWKNLGIFNFVGLCCLLVFLFDDFFYELFTDFRRIINFRSYNHHRRFWQDLPTVRLLNMTFQFTFSWKTFTALITTKMIFFISMEDFPTVWDCSIWPFNLLLNEKPLPHWSQQK